MADILAIHPDRVFANFATARLVEEAIRRGEGELAANGALTARTGARTGRSPNDKFVVQQAPSADQIDWTLNQPMEPAVFARLHQRVLEYLSGQDRFTFDGFTCADPRHRLRIRVVAEKAWHALFARCLFIRPRLEDMANFTPDWTVLNAGSLRCDPARDGHPERGVRGDEL